MKLIKDKAAEIVEGFGKKSGYWKHGLILNYAGYNNIALEVLI